MAVAPLGLCLSFGGEVEEEGQKVNIMSQLNLLFVTRKQTLDSLEGPLTGFTGHPLHMSTWDTEVVLAGSLLPLVVQGLL